jgi:ADP-ribosylglycohydrolase
MSTDGSVSGWAPARNRCEHAEAHVVLAGLSVENIADAQYLSAPCSVSGCENTEQNWLCLECHKLMCGRFANQHMVKHNETSGHCVALGLGDLSFWCYGCDSYLNHLSIRRIYDVYYTFHIAKFGEPTPLPCKAPADASDASSSSSEAKSGPSALAAATAKATQSASSSHVDSHVSAGTSVPDALAIDGIDEKDMANPVINRILGAIYGNALGDAYGLSTEFLDRKTVQRIYPARDKLIPFPDYVKSAHSKRWHTGDWTDDTDQMILIIDTLLETNGKLVKELFGEKLKFWSRRGFPELGDYGGMGLGFTVGSVLNHPKFDTDPHTAAKAIWVQMNRNGAANGAVMRTSILGCWQYDDIDSVIKNTLDIAKVTHYDPRCLASCVATTTALALMLQGHEVDSDGAIDQLCAKAEEHAIASCGMTDEHCEAFVEHMRAKHVSDLKLDEPRKIGYTLKCVGSGFYALRAKGDFKHILHDIVREAGDADTNGAVAGALLGARLGYRDLPGDWISAMPNKKWLDKRVVKLLHLMELI